MLLAHVLQDKGRAVFTASTSATLEQAAKELAVRGIGALVILDDDGLPAGVLSERDIIRELARGGSARLGDPVRTAMTRDIVTASPHESVDDGLARMTDRRIRHLPVLDRGRLVGVVSIGDLVKHRIAAIEAESAAMVAYIAAQ